MSRRILLLFLALVFGGPAMVTAQWYEPGHSFFEPLVEFEEYERIADGVYFNYDRVYWSAHTERIQVGSPTAIRQHFEIWGRGGPPRLDTDLDGILDPQISFNPILRPRITNGLDQLFSTAAFDQGNRFEIGRREDGSGWFISLMAPYDITQSADFGFGQPIQNESNGLISPLGSVVVLFDYPDRFMDGFLDVYDGAIIGTVPGDVLEDDSNGDGILDGDGIADDINLNGIHGPDFADLLPPGEIPDTVIEAIDFGDLVELPTTFQTVNVQSSLETTSAQFMKFKELQATRSDRTGVALLYGIRYTRFKDELFVNATGGVLGQSSWDTVIRNHLFGPQLGCRWDANHGRWGFELDGRALMAVNFEDWEQDVAIGQDLIPSQHNHPLYFSPTVHHHGKRKYEFAPMGELKFTTRYRLTKGFTVNLGFNGLFVDGVRRAGTHIKYRLPEMGFVEGKRESIFLTGINMGFSFVH